jgi:hypothetical protein
MDSGLRDFHLVIFDSRLWRRRTEVVCVALGVYHVLRMTLARLAHYDVVASKIRSSRAMIN